MKRPPQSPCLGGRMERPPLGLPEGRRLKREYGIGSRQFWFMINGSGFMVTCFTNNRSQQ